MNPSGSAACGACAACPAHDLANLVKLGVDMENWDYVVALAGNPNTGKSTVFNALTGLRQHTGNWPGKTVSRAEGGFLYGGNRYKLVDLPGSYSLLSAGYDEEIARDFILFGRPAVTVIVADANRLERNLNLVQQVLEITDRAVVCLNLMDEAKRHGLSVDDRRLARDLGVPVTVDGCRENCAPVQIARMAGWFPEVPVIVDVGFRPGAPPASLGQALPPEGRIAETAVETPNIYLGLTAMAAVELYLIKRLLTVVGPERLVFGSNAPYGIPTIAVEGFRLAQLGGQVEEGILGETLRQLYRLD